MKKNNKAKKITAPLTPETLYTFSQTDDVEQLKKIIAELRHTNESYLNTLEKMSKAMAWQAKRISELMGIPEPPEPKKEDDTFLFPGLN